LDDVWALDLGRRFDAVLGLSHLVNSRSRERRLGLLRTCRHHLRDGGVALIQRYPPGWVPLEGARRLGRVTIWLHEIEMLEDGFSAEVTYRVGSDSWTQAFDAAIVDDAELDRMADEVGLSVVDELDDDGEWVLLGATTA